MSNRIIRVLVRGAYDIQKLRIQMGNRIVGNYKARLGIPPGTKEKDKLEADKNIHIFMRCLQNTFCSY